MKQNHNIYFHRTSLQGFGCNDVVYQSEKPCNTIIFLDICLTLSNYSPSVVSPSRGEKEKQQYSRTQFPY
jgi:hypothetical protein